MRTYPPTPNVWILITLWVSWCFAACSDKKEDFSTVPGVEKYTWNAKETLSSEGETKTYTFHAFSEWTATCNADWCSISPSSGKKGNGRLTIQVSPNETDTYRSTSVLISVKGYQEVSFILEQDKMEVVEVRNQTDMNPIVDDFLKRYYLWNTDYQSMKRDLAIPYIDTYDNFLRNTLMQMTTNTLDKKLYQGNDYTLYSFLDRKKKKRSAPSSRSGGVNHGIEKDDKERSYGFDMLSVGILDQEEGVYAFIVNSVYPDSPASTFGITRGTYIWKINGKPVTNSNLDSSYLNLLTAKEDQVKLECYFPSGTTKEIILTAMEIEKTPILKTVVLEESGYKIGYLNFNSFHGGYDDDLLAILKDFKSQGVTELVLDLRYNGGGHVTSSKMLASCIAGDQCQNEKFMYYRFNDSRMKEVENTQKETGHTYDSSAQMFYEEFSYPTYCGVDLTAYSLGLNRLFVLTGPNSASASELLISSLEGIHFPVTLIGETTNGKNVGMEGVEFDAGDYTYELYPITFQVYNALKETVSSKGMEPDYPVNDWNYEYIDFGNEQEPMLAKAIELITGKKTSSAKKSRNSAWANIERTNMPLPLDISKRKTGSLIVRKKF